MCMARNVGLDNLEKLAHAFQIKVADLLATGPDWRRELSLFMGRLYLNLT